MMDMLQTYKNPVQSVFKKLCSVYGQQFVRKDMAPQLLEWIKGISEAQLPIENLEEYTLYITKQSIEFKKYPPKLSQYIAGFKEWYSLIKNNNDKNKLSFEEQFDAFYLEMNLRYEGLWGRSESVGVDAHREFWRRELKEKIEDGYDLKAFVKKIREISKFKVYPPNIDQFIELVKISRYDSNLPLIEDAYDLAIASKNPDSIHPLIRHVRSRFGYTNLIDRRNPSIKTRFEDEYRESVKKLINGQLDLSSINTSENSRVGESSSPCQTEHLINCLDEMLKKMGESV